MAGERTDLPHVMQKFDWDCGIACIQMILLKLQQIFDDSAIFDALPTLGIGESVWTIDLANILRHFNIDCVYYTITCGVDPGYRDNAFYRDNAYFRDGFDAEETRVNTLFEKAEEMGIRIIKRSITMADIFSKLDDRCIAVVLANSNILKCNSCNYPWTYPISHDDSTSAEYGGHYIVLCGYDTEMGVIFCKNPSSKDIECCMDISSFDLARKSYGTDEDIIFINMNPPEIDI